MSGQLFSDLLVIDCASFIAGPSAGTILADFGARVIKIEPPVGPESANTGYDATAWWARSGLMDAVRASVDTPPAISVPGMGDQMAACSLYGAISVFQ
jgi:crotonobetainyl-CoA:carnitine CoA-transferase CaiB-like acyl-CoA transferase